MNDDQFIDFEKKITEESAKSLFHLAWSTINSVRKRSIDEFKVKQALKKYTENYIKRHGQIKVLGMAEPIPLLDIYTSVFLIYPNYRTKEREIEEIDHNFRSNRGYHIVSNDRFSGVQIANEKAKINILGAPGSGKSTFLRRIGIEALLNRTSIGQSNTFNHDVIPVLIELKRFKTETIDLKKMIQKEFEVAGFPESDFFVESALKKGKLLLLFDGIDEVPNAILNNVIEHLKDFTDKYSINRFVTSCRTAFYKTYLDHFTDVEIAAFDDLQVQSFINNWFRREIDKIENVAGKFSRQLFDASNKATLELARTPLLLTFLCLTYDESQRFPANRSNLYRRALLILLEKWAAEKRIHNEDVFQDLSSELEIEMLSVIASEFYIEDRIFFYEEELKTKIKYFLESILEKKFIPAGKVLEAIEVQQGLLVQRSPDVYSFSHLTIQEYLTAHYFYSPQNLSEFVKNYLFVPRWREVFLLVAGFGNANEFLMLMLHKLEAYSSRSKTLNLMLGWVHQLLPTTEQSEIDLFKRVYVLSLLLRFKRYDNDAYSSSFRKETFAIKLMQALDPTATENFSIPNNITTKAAVDILELISQWGYRPKNFQQIKSSILAIQPPLPLNQMLEGSRSKFRKEILTLLYYALDVPMGMGQLSKNSYDPVSNYLEACYLIVDCKNAALRVSKSVWQIVLDRMLRPSIEE